MAAPVEAKVKASTAGSYLASVAGLSVLDAVAGMPRLVGFLPDMLEPLVLALVPAAAAFLSGYQARHTPRSR